MIPYHGTPITPISVAAFILAARHAMISFANPEQIGLCAEVCQSFALDNGAFSVWKAGRILDIPGYIAWVEKWMRHPGFDWCLIPDVIEGDEKQNDKMIECWPFDNSMSVPVWHMHESIDRLVRLGNEFPRIALGSSGQWETPGTSDWWDRMSEAMNRLCVDGHPPCKLHGLRMLNPTVFSALPLSSADSTNVARNIGIDVAWDRGFSRETSKATRALILANRIEAHASATRWTARTEQMNFELIG